YYRNLQSFPTRRSSDLIADVRDFEDVVVAKINDAPIHIRDIGTVEDGTIEQRTLSRLNGVPNVTIEIRRQSGANTIEVINAAKRSEEHTSELQSRVDLV